MDLTCWGPSKKTHHWDLGNSIKTKPSILLFMNTGKVIGRSRSRSKVGVIFIVVKGVLDVP